MLQPQQKPTYSRQVSSQLKSDKQPKSLIQQKQIHELPSTDSSTSKNPISSNYLFTQQLSQLFLIYLDAEKTSSSQQSDFSIEQENNSILNQSPESSASKRLEYKLFQAPLRAHVCKDLEKKKYLNEIFFSFQKFFQPRILEEICYLLAHVIYDFSHYDSLCLNSQKMLQKAQISALETAQKMSALHKIHYLLPKSQNFCSVKERDTFFQKFVHRIYLEVWKNSLISNVDTYQIFEGKASSMKQEGKLTAPPRLKTRNFLELREQVCLSDQQEEGEILLGKKMFYSSPQSLFQTKFHQEKENLYCLSDMKLESEEMWIDSQLQMNNSPQ